MHSKRKTGKYELLMEAKDDGEAVRMYTVGDEKTVTSFVMVSQEKDVFIFALRVNYTTVFGVCQEEFF